MYICICNALTEKQVESAIQDGADSTGSVYKHHGCEVRCGKCVRDVADRLRVNDMQSQPAGLPIMDTGPA